MIMNVMIYFGFKLSFRDKYPIPLVNRVGILELRATVTQVLGQTNRESENRLTVWQSVLPSKRKELLFRGAAMMNQSYTPLPQLTDVPIFCSISVHKQ